MRLALALLLVGSAVAAQTPAPAVPSIPRTGGSVADFTPAGWRVEQQLEATLTNSAQPDIVVSLVQDAAGTPQRQERALVILRRTADGRLERAAYGPRVLWCRGMGECVEPKDVPELSIDRSALVIHHVNNTLRFRLDAPAGQFVLIGEDFWSPYKAGGRDGWAHVSTNHLTGRQILERRETNAAGKEVVVDTATRTVEKVRRTIEETSVHEDVFDRRRRGLMDLAALPVKPDDRVAARTKDDKIVRVPRAMLVAVLEVEWSETVHDIASSVYVRRLLLADPRTAPEDRRLPGDAEFYLVTGPFIECGTIGCPHSIYWGSVSTGKGGALLRNGEEADMFGEYDGLPIKILKSSTNGLFDLDGFRFDGTRYRLR